MKNDTVHMLWYFHHFSYIKCVQLWIWYTLTYKYLQRVSKFIKNLPCVTYKLFQWLLKFVKYVPCGGEFDQRGGGVSIAAPLKYIKCVQLWIWYTLTYKYLQTQRVSKLSKMYLPCVTYKLFQWLLKFVKYVPCGGWEGGGRNNYSLTVVKISWMCWNMIKHQ